MQHAALPLAGLAAAAAAFLYRRELKALLSPMATLPKDELEARGIKPGPGGRKRDRELSPHSSRTMSTLALPTDEPPPFFCVCTCSRSPLASRDLVTPVSRAA